MRNFEHVNARSVAEASRLLSQKGKTVAAIAGGQDLLCLLKDRLLEPDVVVNLKTIPGLNRIEFDEAKGLLLGSLVTLSELEEHPLVRRLYPALAEAAASVGSPQIRNMGTVGGNLCQRPRCWYFRGNFPCLRRGGDYCSAAAGQNRYHCILGGDPCYMVHPSDLAVPLVAYGARVEVTGPKGRRWLALEDFFVLPRVELARETVLKPGELVTAVAVPPPEGRKSAFVKFTERGAWDFAVASAAVVLGKGDGRLRGGRIVLGGVAPIPWVARKASAALVDAEASEEKLAELAELALEGAQPLSQNSYKVALTKSLVRRAMAQALAS
ncbi:MAG: xanthine dehydrogenase family protein subunit M [candidate division KSB1 bacterium]|nr:xanthine dehydrogenase family protein subunit M [candidate division KSB1 bacterium]